YLHPLYVKFHYLHIYSFLSSLISIALFKLNEYIYTLSTIYLVNLLIASLYISSCILYLLINSFSSSNLSVLKSTSIAFPSITKNRSITPCIKLLEILLSSNINSYSLKIAFAFFIPFPILEFKKLYILLILIYFL